MAFHTSVKIFLVLMMTAILTTGISFVLQDAHHLIGRAPGVPDSLLAAISLSVLDNNIVSTSPQFPPPPQKLSNPPAIIKAVYVTGHSAGSKKYLNYLTNLLAKTEINAVVVDIKDYSGLVSYNSAAEETKKYNLYNNAIPDINALVKFFHDKNIYVIGRIAVFEDPGYSKARPELAVYNKAKTSDLSKPILWQDNNGLSWLDPASKDVWDYNISLAKDVFSHGFDEVNFDYVRFPSDGKVENMGFPVWDGKSQKADIIKEFFQYLRANLPGEKISVDLFGQTTINKDDMGIGQLIENAFENFDYVSPMVYPSHYANEFMGFANPADHPYDIIKYSMDSALARENSFLDKQQVQDLPAVGSNEGTTPVGVQPTPSGPTHIIVPLAKFRPWLQDFNLGAYYTADMIKQEIKATQDALGSNFTGFMLWNPSNIYTRGAVENNDVIGPK